MSAECYGRCYLTLKGVDFGPTLSETGWEDQVHVAGAGKKLEEEGLVELSESPSGWFPGDEGRRASEMASWNQDYGTGCRS